MNEKQNWKNKFQTISEQNVEKYITRRFNQVKKSKKITELTRFQASNKYMMMAHSQEELKILGNIVASYKKRPLSKILEEYEIHLTKCLENQPTIKKHANVILHIYGYFSKNFTLHEKEKFWHTLERFKNQEIWLGDVLAGINPMIFKFDNTYLVNQTYFLLYSKSQSDELLQSLYKKCRREDRQI